MAKWKSPLFSDIRNKLGESAVFSMWKGRPYFRSYVVPANPKTNKQMAHRYELKELVARWKDVMDNDDKVAEWNKEALPYQISGYNLFTKFGRKSKISCPATGSGASPVTVEVTYTLGLGASNAKLYMYDGTTWTDETPVEGLEAGADKTVDVDITSSGTYVFFIAYDQVLVDPDEPPQDYQAITCWEPDETNGVAKLAECVVTVS